MSGAIDIDVDVDMNVDCDDGGLDIGAIVCVRACAWLDAGIIGHGADEIGSAPVSSSAGEIDATFVNNGTATGNGLVNGSNGIKRDDGRLAPFSVGKTVLRVLVERGGSGTELCAS